jgi:hypothetical protein
MNIVCIESFSPQKTHNWTLLFGRMPKHGRHFDHWDQPLNVHMCICYLDWHEAGLCCYLVIHTENPLHPLTVVLLTFVTYLPTPSYNLYNFYMLGSLFVRYSGTFNLFKCGKYFHSFSHMILQNF